MEVALVVVELGLKNINRPFSYLIPPHLQSDIKKGIRVLVPFGNRKLTGFIIDIIDSNEISYEMKPIIDIIDNEIILNEELLSLGKYIADNTLSYLISAYQSMLPKALKASSKKSVSIKTEVFLKLNKNVLVNKLTDKQKMIYDYLLMNDECSKKAIVSNFSSSSLKTLINKGIVIEIIKEVYRDVLPNVKQYNRIKLNPEQQLVYDIVKSDLCKYQPYLLYGVTGSGKTEVYLQLIQNVINQGKEAIVLVPEISLTPQMVERFKGRFGHLVAVLHSGLSDGEKYDEWRRINRKEVKIVVGARSAIFAPFTNLGIIIIDEEHESSYKQENNPKYHTTDVAIYRAKYHKCPLILGSATPTVESYAKAIKGIYKLLVLPNRINHQSLPTVSIIDMKDELHRGNRSIFSNVLIDKINDRIKKNEQIVLFLNRRGYANYLMCRECGYTHRCPHCDITLTYHKGSNLMKCHYCGYGTNVLKKCPSCDSHHINTLGYGTERIYEMIISQIKGAKVLRMDVDTTSTKGAHERMLNDFKHQKYNILLGTQMISKGLDFPKVTLVGVLNADTTLNIPDFRSGERTFQLLTQVAGRAGRGDLLGEVIIQTFNPDNYAIKFVKNHDYLGFLKKEMQLRKALDYPPYYNLISIIIRSKDLNLLIKESDKVALYLNNHKEHNTEILGPASATIPKINDYYRYQCLIKYKRDQVINDTLKALLEHYQNNSKIELDIDLNPTRTN